MNYGTGRIRKITILDNIENTDNIGAGIRWEFKNNISNADLNEYGMRFSVSREKPIDPYQHMNVDFIRNVKRRSYACPGLGKIDLSIIDYEKYVLQNKEITKIRYEVEFEADPDIFKNIIQKDRYKNITQHIYLLINDSHLIYDLNTKNRIINAFNGLLGSRQKYSFDKKVITHARPIKYRDIVWGGLIGNPKTNYRVSHKADGQRGFLFIYERNIWLLSGSSDVNKIHHLGNSQMDRTILDIEVIPYKNRNMELQNTPRVPYWFVVLDGLYIQSVDIRSDDHNNRLMKTQSFIQYFQNNSLLNITSKSFYSIDRPEELFSIVRDIDNQPKLYETDGLVFVPNKVPYITHQDQNVKNPDNLPLRLRTLTNIPEIVKWKPVSEITIDLMIIKNQDGSAQLLTSEVDNSLVSFTGSRYAPFNVQMLSKNSIWDRAISGNIVEFSWNSKNNKLIPKQIRLDKRFPNRKAIAIDNWNDINDPININVLKGQSIKLMRKYHNRVKRALFDRAGNQKKNGTILDIGSGRGGDIYSMNRHFSRMLLVEPQSSHIAELISRLYNGGVGERILALVKADEKQNIQNLLTDRGLDLNNGKIIFIDNIGQLTSTIRPTDKAMILQTVGQDNELIRNATQIFLGGPADVVSMMFSLSFFWESPDILNKLAQTISENNKPNGIYIFTTIDGNAVKQVFRPALGGLALNKVTDPDNLIDMEYIETDNRPKIKLNIKDTIVGSVEDSGVQTEWLVIITDLENRLQEYNYKRQMYQRLQDEALLTPVGQRYSQLMYAGIFKRHSDIIESTISSQPPNQIVSLDIDYLPIISSAIPLDSDTQTESEVQMLNLFPIIQQILNQT